ncbi:cytochrome P450 2U1-like [Physella acuta]|uniref:cytochrome P450 2U1-like n=1 Tax=Physella acuta TaxID=109671 RepID=UPI0027DBA30F|nr:cytochrome P450 2U1-like [Physella acuta]
MLEDIVSALTAYWWMCLILLTLTTLFYLHNPPPNSPPSPGLALPVIGHLYLLGKDPREIFRSWARRHGNVFHLKLGAASFVVLNDVKTIKEAFVKQADIFSNRSTKDFIAKYVPRRTNGLALSSGSVYKELKLTSMTILKNLGMGKNILAEKISEGVVVYLQEITELKGIATNIRPLTDICVANIICSMIFGKKFDFDDPIFNRLLDLNHQFVIAFRSTSICNFFPFLRYIPFDPFKGRSLPLLKEEIGSYTQKIVTQFVEEFDPQNTDYFIAAFLADIKQKTHLGQATLLDLEKLSVAVEDLFAAGAETTSTTVVWAMLYSLHHPHIQDAIHHELLQNVGVSRLPALDDKPNLTYLNAFIMELQRISAITPYGLIHECNRDTTLGGFAVPKGTQVMPNLDYIFHDPRVWGDPESFRPERFIDEQGRVVSPEEFIPFSVGRRSCLGESMAKMELFLFLSALFQRFQLLPADPMKLPTLQGVFGAAVAPETFEIRLVERKF